MTDRSVEPTGPEPIDPSQYPARPGERIGHYFIEAVIGSGGMGVVFRGHDTRLVRPVAIKALSLGLVGDRSQLEWIEREAKLLASVNHPNIATVYSIEEAGGRPMLVLEYVPGESLAERLERGPLGVAATLDLGRQVAAALEAAHEQGVIHRDLKPANLRVTPKGIVKVLDFGLAKAIDVASERRGEMAYDTATTDNSLHGGVVGTLSYMSPEQARAEAVDRRTDIWSLGCILWECLTGERLWRAATVSERVRAVLSQTPNWSVLPETAPVPVRALIERCLQKERSARPSSCTEVRVALEDALAEVSDSRRGRSHRRADVKLPAELTSFVGRAEELRWLTRAMAESRLVTLTGVAGCGKTRLALRLAGDRQTEHADGVALVELAPIKGEELVPQAVATALELRERAGVTFTEVLCEYLRDRDLLLVLDNCEHVLRPCAVLADSLLRHCPSLRIVATSREGLGITGEILHAVPSLALPDVDAPATTDEIARVESIQLFVERARAVRADFELRPDNLDKVQYICRRLDGIPLGIELAAARLGALSVEQVASRISDCFHLLTGGSRSALPRQQTLRAAIDWSYDLLTDDERRLFRRLAVFGGGFSLESAEQVASSDELPDVVEILTHLVAKSLLVVDRTEAGPRYRYLEAVRQYALERLVQADEADELRRRHAVALAEVLARAGDGSRGRTQMHRIAALEREHDNVRAALDWCMSERGSAEEGLRIAGRMGWFWDVCGHWSEGRRRLTEALARAGDEAPGDLRARALRASALLASRLGELAEAQELHEASLELFRASGDRSAVAEVLNSLGVIADDRGDLEAARWRYQESLALHRELGESRGVADSLSNLGLLEHTAGQYDRAQAQFEESLEVFRKLDDARGMTAVLGNLALLAQSRQDLEAAERLFLEALVLARRLGERAWEARILANLGTVAQHADDPRRACTLYRKSLAICRELGDRLRISHVLVDLGEIAHASGDRAAALRHVREALELARHAGGREGIARCLQLLGTIAVDAGDAERGTLLLGAAAVQRELAGEVPDPRAASAIAATAAAARDALGDAAFDAAWRRARRLGVDEAVAIALR